MADQYIDDLLDPTLEWDAGQEKLTTAYTKKLQGVTVSTTPPEAGQVLKATSDTTAEWGGVTGTMFGPDESVIGNIPSFDSEDGTSIDDSGVAIADLVLDDDSRLTDARTPTAHHASHENGGADEISVEGLSGLLATAQTPTAHSTSHKHGGTDEIATTTAGANLIPKAGAGGKIDNGWLDTGTGSSQLILGNDTRLTNARTPTSHASTHQDGGADEISVAGLSGLLATPQTPVGHHTSHENGGTDEISVAGLSGELADPQPPKTHASSHANGGSDEISVAGLSGVLADSQVANKIATSGTPVTLSSTAPTTGQVLKATSATGASWQTIAAGGDFSGPASSTNNNLVKFGDTTGKLGADSGIAVSSVVVTGDSRLSDARTPTAHASSHQNGGSDEVATATAGANAIPKAGAGGTLAIGWIPTGTSSTTVCVGDDARLSNSRNPTAHKTSHQTGGADEISVAGLSGVLADSQVANKIATSGTAVTVSSTAPSTGQVLKATSASAASWQTLSFGDVNGPGSSTDGNLPKFSGTGGKTLVDSGIAIANVIVEGDSRLTNSRTPTTHSTSHKHGGADEVATATAGANAIPKTGAGGTLDIAWIPTGTSSTTVCIGNDSRLSDNRTADKIATSGTPVSISSTAPSAGHVLTATSATAASWQASVSSSGFSTGDRVVWSGSAWVPKFSGRAEQSSASSNFTTSAVTYLSVTVPRAGSYAFWINAVWNRPNTTSSNCTATLVCTNMTRNQVNGWQGTGDMSNAQFMGGKGTTTFTTNSPAASGAQTTAGDRMTVLNGSFTTSASGVFGLQYAVTTAGSNTTLQPGSVMVVEEV